MWAAQGEADVRTVVDTARLGAVRQTLKGLRQNRRKPLAGMDYCEVDFV